MCLAVVFCCDAVVAVAGCFVEYGEDECFFVGLWLLWVVDECGYVWQQLVACLPVFA